MGDLDVDSLAIEQYPKKGSSNNGHWYTNNKRIILQGTRKRPRHELVEKDQDLVLSIWVSNSKHTQIYAQEILVHVQPAGQA